MIPLYKFGVFGGLGDVIIQSFKHLPYIYTRSYQSKIVVIVGDFICPKADELFKGFGPYLTIIRASDIHHNKERLVRKEKEYTTLYLQDKLSHPDFTQLEVFPHGKTLLLKPQKPKREYRALDKLTLEYLCDNEPVTCIANIARTKQRTIDTDCIQRYMELFNNPNYIQIGVNNGEAVNQVCNHRNIYCAVNQTSIQGALSIIDNSERLVCCDSAMMCYGMMTEKPMDIILNDFTHPKYGLFDKDQRQGYFKCFDLPTTRVFDNELNQLN